MLLSSVITIEPFRSIYNAFFHFDWSVSSECKMTSTCCEVAAWKHLRDFQYLITFSLNTLQKVSFYYYPRSDNLMHRIESKQLTLYKINHWRCLSLYERLRLQIVITSTLSRIGGLLNYLCLPTYSQSKGGGDGGEGCSRGGSCGEEII